MQLKTAMRETLADWPADLPGPWQHLARDVALDFEAIDPELELEAWEPIFPCRRGRVFPGMPPDAHMFRAFDGINPDAVRCVILGQDPYPAPDFSTGRAFEAGNIIAWRELDKMFSKSVRAFMQLVAVARTGDDRFAGSFAQWPTTLAALEAGTLALETPRGLADRWVSQGVLLLNASLTLSRFKVDIDPHQSRGHWPLWRPLIVAVLRASVALRTPIVLIGFGDVAAELIDSATTPDAHLTVILREHPAHADAVLARDNPFRLANAALAAAGAEPIGW